MIIDGSRTSLAGLPMLNPTIAQVARSALMSQGLNPDLISPSGELDLQKAIALAYDRIEIHSSLSAPIIINLNAPSDPATQAILNRVKPRLVFVGRAGNFEIAPYGVAPGIDAEIPKWGGTIGIGVGAGLLGLLLLGKALF